MENENETETETETQPTGFEIIEVSGESIVNFLKSLPLAEDSFFEGLSDPWGGDLNKRLAFEIAEAMGKDQARNFLRFAQLVVKYAE